MAPVIEAGELILSDSNGIMRARLGCHGGDVYVGPTLYGSDGQSRICISTAAAGNVDRATILINDPDGCRRAVVNVGRNGTGLRLFDENEKPRVSLGYSMEGGSRLTLVGPNGEVLFSAPGGEANSPPAGGEPDPTYPIN